MASDGASNKRTFDKVTGNDRDNHDATTTREGKPERYTVYESSSFLPCHLKILRALYTTAKDNATKTTGISDYVTDEAVSEEVWGMVERFLEQQHELRRIKHQANHWRTIADESNDRNQDRKSVV